MQDDNMTASTQTTDPVDQTATTPNPAQEPVSTSTTDPKDPPKDLPADDEPPSKTILTEGDDDVEGDGTAADTNEFHGAPEGDYQLEGLPEGTVIDEEALAAISPIARELNLSNAGLSKIAGVYAETVLPKVVDNLTDGMQRDIAAQHAAWATETTDMVKTDAAFEGKTLKEVQQISAKTLDRFGGKDFRVFLENTGLGNHPAMVKFAYLAGQAISEDTTFERGNTPPKEKSRTEKYYGPQS